MALHQSKISHLFCNLKIETVVNDKTGVTDYRFLDNMPQLEGIDISQNNLKDISFLSKYKNLTLVAAADNGIEDIRPLGQLPNLKFLVLSNNKISDLSPVSHKESLTVVDLSRNADVDLATLQAPKLETLMVNDTKVSHLDFLKNNLIYLTYLLTVRNCNLLKVLKQVASLSE